MAKGKATRTGGLIIVGLLILGLAGFGATNFGGSAQVAGTVGDTEITLQDYARALQSELRAVSESAGRNVTMSEAISAGLDRAVLGRLVAEKALDDEAARLGLSVSDDTVAAQVVDVRAFQGIDGTFDRDTYAFVLERNGLSIADYENEVREDISRRLVSSAATAGVRMPAGFTETLFAYARETRDITWALFDADDLTEPLPEPSEAELEAWHAENEMLFTLAQERAITYAWLTPEMLLDTVDLDATAVRDLYQSRIDEYVQPERRLVERLVYGSVEAASAARAQLDAGEAGFDDLVEARGLTLDDVDLGDVSEAELGAAGADIFALAEPGVVGPLPSALGPALFRMNAILSAQEVPFEDAREELEAELSGDRARRLILEMTGEIDDLLASGATLEELATETEMELGQIDWRPDVTDGIAAYDEFRDAAGAVVTGDFPEVLDFAEGGIFAIRLDELRPPRLQPLDEVRPRVIEGWEADATSDRLMSQALAAADQIRGGREMAALRLDLRTDRGLTRDGFLEEAPPGMIAGVFAMAPGELQVFEAPGGAVLVRLDTVTVPDATRPENRILTQTFGLQANQGAATDVLEYFTRAVEARAGIRINQSALNAVHASMP